MIVTDSSVVLELLTAPSLDPGLMSRIQDERLHVPHLVDVETMNGLRGLAAGRRISVARAEEARDRYASLPLLRYGHALLLDRVWELRGQLTAYDACYVALAEALKIPLVTTDRRLARSKGHRAEIELY